MTLFLILVLGISFAGTPENHDRFYSYVLNDFDRHSSFLAIDIVSDEYSGRVVIENAELFNFFHQTRGFNKAKYKVSIKKLLTSEEPLRLGKTSLSKWGFMKVSRRDNILDAAKKGTDSFISQYFQSRALKPGVDEEDQKAIISTLFELKVPTVIDDLTGYLIIIPLK